MLPFPERAPGDHEAFLQRFDDADGFSVRWSRSLALPAGNYRFTMTVDDGAPLCSIVVERKTTASALKKAKTLTKRVYGVGAKPSVRKV